MNEDIRSLIDPLVNIAAQHLQEEGEGPFPPSGAIVTSAGEIQLVKPHEGEAADDPEAQTRLLQAAFEQYSKEKGLRACAFSLDVMVKDPRTEEDTQAILVSAESSDGGAFHVVVPYSRGDELELGEPFASKREPRVFGEGALAS